MPCLKLQTHFIELEKNLKLGFRFSKRYADILYRMPPDVKCFPTEGHNLCCLKFFPFQSLTFFDTLWVLLLISTLLFKQCTFIGIYLTLNTIKKTHHFLYKP